MATGSRSIAPNSTSTGASGRPVEKLSGRGFGMRLHGLFGHPSFSAIHSDQERPAGWPAKVGDLAYCCIRQPGFSPDCIWIAVTDVVPRCTMTDRGIAVEWQGLVRPGFDMYLGTAPEREVLRRIQDAAGKKRAERTRHAPRDAISSRGA